MVSTSFISVAILAIASVAFAAPVSSQSDVFPGNGHHRGLNATTFPGRGHHYGVGSHAPHPTGSAAAHRPSCLPEHGNKIERRCQNGGSHHHGHRASHASSHTPSHAVPTTTKEAAEQVTSSSASTTTTTTEAATTTTTKATTTTSSAQVASSSSASGSSSLSSDDAEALNLHNEFRAKHSAPALEWNTTLAEYAQNWSDRCVFEHSQGPYGENLAMGYSSWTDAITAWYDEYKNYDYSNPGYSSSTGHFTQVVWKSTSQLGCGVTKCSNGPLYTCSYYVPGNYIGADNFKENVLPN